jgi:peptidoglycan/LPS O-acetylase OafA/YrhL
MNRLYNLDYLRGLAAFGIMLFHYLSWTFGSYSSDSFMGRVGVYGVSIFYVLSGLTLYYVYYNKMSFSRRDVLSFFKKRIFRIFPLLWLVTIAALVIARKVPNALDLFLSLTGLFGFIKWDVSFSVGVWSIGNELVFYAFFPFFILFSKSYKLLMILLSLTFLGLYIYFAFFVLNSGETLTEQWRNYVNPLNQAFLFLGGFLIGLLLSKIKIGNATSILLLLCGLALFVFYPVEGETIHLVTGVNRLVFTLSCFLVCVGFYKLSIALPSTIHKPLTLLGEASYSVYLVHPLVYSVVGIVLMLLKSHQILSLPDSLKIFISAPCTLIVSYFVYEYFEKYFMKFGRKTDSFPQS